MEIAHEKKTALGSTIEKKGQNQNFFSAQLNTHRGEDEGKPIPVGLPSAPIPFFANFCSVNIRRASSKSTPRRFMMLRTSFFAAMSKPDRESPDSMLPAREKASELPARRDIRN